MITVFIIIAALGFLGLVYLGEAALRRGNQPPQAATPGHIGGPSEAPMSTHHPPAYLPIAVSTLTIVPDEFLGLNALIALDGADGGGDTGSAVVSKARALMRGALAGKLQETGLPWAPSAAAVKKRAAEAAEPASGMRALMGNKKVRKYGTSVVAVAALVVLWGGYHWGWKWTGFQKNGQLWDWLTLLLVPVALGTIPLWIQDRDYISRPRRVAYGVVIVAWTGLVIAGYLIPLKWTGFPGTKLWGWLDLILLPVALTTTIALTSSRIRSSKARSLRPYQKGLIAALAVGWIVTVIGHWSWTGYAGKDLWDWLTVLLAPLVFPTILLPALLKWVSGNAARRASEARKPPMLRLAPDPRVASEARKPPMLRLAPDPRVASEARKPPMLRLAPDPRVAQMREHAQREHEIHSRPRRQNPQPPLDRPGLRQDIIDQFERKGLG